MDVAVIIRFRNEAPYLKAVLQTLEHQSIPRSAIEIIAVDNQSTDGSAAIASQYANKLLTIEDYRPGKALNMAIAQTNAPIIVALSAHALPAHEDWLFQLLKHMENQATIGVYGAQLYPFYSEFLDKRDLDRFSTRIAREEFLDSSFWNANSLFRRSWWEKQPFEETVYELEDHYWTKQLLGNGNKIVYEPNALVYHYGHAARIDREHVPPSRFSIEERINNAILALQNRDADWPTLMKAGLTIKSLAHYPLASDAISSMGKLIHHPDFDVRWRIVQALGKFPTQESAEYLVEALRDVSFFPQDEAAWSLARLGSLGAKIVLNHLPTLPTSSLSFAAVALGQSGYFEAEEAAVQLIEEELMTVDFDRQLTAVYTIGEISHCASAQRLQSHLQALLLEDDATIAAVGCWAYGMYAMHHSADIHPLLTLSAHHSDPNVRFEATVACSKVLCSHDEPRIMSELLRNLEDDDSRVRYAVMQGMYRYLENHTGSDFLVSISPQEKDFGVQFEYTSIKTGARIS